MFLGPWRHVKYTKNGREESGIRFMSDFNGTPCVITGYYNNDFYMEEIYNPIIGRDKVKNNIAKALPIGKQVKVVQATPQCDNLNVKMCPHGGKCYEIVLYEEGIYSEYTACMIKFKELEPESE